ncbi:MAG TPA: hypothetical protein VFW65_32125 [Pseudonocardiaceae bacterium]|nr:hypothetical protein [Pseudonocardiaceae bacterium]
MAAAGAVPMMDATGTTPVNTAANYRQGLLGAFLAPAPGGPMVWRSGVLPTSLPAGSTVNGDLWVGQTTTASRSVLVAPGNCVIPRSGAAGGPYIATFPATSTVVADPASSTNPRIDLVCVQLVDAALGDSGTQGAALIIVNGTPASSPSPPATPTGAIVLAQLLRPISTDPVVAANITDVRKATGTYGGVRCLLPGDQVTDAGSYIGELTYDAATSTKAGWRYWDGAAWRALFAGILPLIKSANNVNGSTNSTGNSYGVPANSCSVTVTSTSGLALVIFSATLHANTAGDNVRGAIAVTGATSVAALTTEGNQAFIQNSSVNAVMATFATVMAINPGTNTYTLEYRNSSSASNTFGFGNQSVTVLAP